MSEEWETLQHRLAAAYNSFLAACDHLDPGLYENGTLDGQWSLRDMVAHLTGWDHEATERFWRFLAGPTEDISYSADAINKFNARSVAARQHLTYNQAVKELRGVHRGLEEAIAAVQPDDLAEQSGFVEWLSELSKHYEAHTAQLEHVTRHT